MADDEADGSTLALVARFVSQSYPSVVARGLGDADGEEEVDNHHEKAG